MEIKGNFDESLFEQSTDYQRQQVKDLNNTASPKHVFNSGFLESHTDFKTFQALEYASPLSIESTEREELESDPEFQSFINVFTEFEDFDEMLRAGVADYITE